MSRYTPVDLGDISDDHARGLKCEWRGVKTNEMDTTELVAFIGMLDAHATNLALQLLKTRSAPC